MRLRGAESSRGESFVGEDALGLGRPRWASSAQAESLKSFLGRSLLLILRALLPNWEPRRIPPRLRRPSNLGMLDPRRKEVLIRKRRSSERRDPLQVDISTIMRGRRRSKRTRS